MTSQRGFTLIELMVTVAIIAVISAIAIPVYQNYLQSAREGVLLQNINTMRIFQEEFRIQNGTYSAFVWEPGDPTTPIGWRPDQEGGTVTYTVTVDAGPPPSYTVTAEDVNGTTVTRTF